jgi:hypothetical protein
MSQYFTYENLQGRLPIDALTANPSCKTCSTSKCYSTYDNVQGVSLSKHMPWVSVPLGINQLGPIETQSCQDYMLNCHVGNLVDNDPYNITVKTISPCDVSDAKYYNIDLPLISGSLDRSRTESPRAIAHKSMRNSSNIAADLDNKIRSIKVPVSKINLSIKKEIKSKKSSSDSDSESKPKKQVVSTTKSTESKQVKSISSRVEKNIPKSKTANTNK